MGTYTDNIALYKPTEAEIGWADEINANFDTVDTRLHKPLGIQYVDRRGDNANDGLTPGTAKHDVVSAYDALDADGGHIRVIGSTTAGDIPFWDFDNQDRGLWIVGASDSQYAGLPANGPDASGFRRSKPLILEGWGGRESYHDAVGGYGPLTFIAGASQTDPLKPALWLSGCGDGFRFIGIRAVNLAQTVKLGLDTADGITNTNTAGITFERCYFSSNAAAANAATTQATVKSGYTYWTRFIDCTLDHQPTILTVSSITVSAGTTYTFTTATAHGLVANDVVDVLGNTPSGYNGLWTVVATPTASTFTADIGSNPAALSVAGTVRAILSDRQAAAFLAADSTDANPGIVMFKNSTFAGAGVRYSPAGSTGWHNIVMEDCIEEGNFVNDIPPIFTMPARSIAPFHATPAGSGFIFLRNLGLADGGAPFGTVDVRSLKDPSMVTVINCGPVLGSFQSAGGTQFAMDSGLADGDKVGMFQGESRRIFGQHDGHRRAFHPTAARYANLAVYDETTWQAGSGTATVATGQTAPDGTSRAGLVTAVASPDATEIYRASRTVNIGDFFIAGGWYKMGANGYGTDSSYYPFSVQFAGSTFKFDTAQVSASGFGLGALYGYGRTGDGDWQFIAEAYRVSEGSGSPEVVMKLHVQNGFPFYFYAPVLMHVPVADGVTYAEAREIRDSLCSYSNTLAAGDVGTLPGQNFHVTGPLEVDGALNHDGTTVGFYGTTPVAKPTVTGSRGGNAALADLLTELAAMGLITDSSSA